MFTGSYVALVTPMTDAGEVDFPAFERLIEWHLEQGTDGFVVLGTTAESPTITSAEREAIIKRSVALVRNQKPVIVGTGTNSTQSTITLTQQAKELGADAVLLITPYYNKPTQEGLFLHHQAIAKAVAIPQILYNNPTRTGCDLLPQTVKRIAALPNVVALKETVADVERYHVVLNETSLKLLSGSDGDALELLLAGGHGVISVAANVVPQQFHQFCWAALNGEVATAREWDVKLQPLFNALFIESNPIPTKWALQQMGMIERGIRLPLTWLEPQHEAAIRAVLTNEDIACVLN